MKQPKKSLFVSYELAIKLKENGFGEEFNEDCFGYYDIQSKQFYFAEMDERKVASYIPSILCSAPIYQQVVDWLDLKGYNISIKP